MADSKGYQGIVGWRKATAWGTALAAGAGHGIEIINSTMAANRQLEPDNSIVGRVTQREPDKGNLVVAGSILMPLRYEGPHRILAGLQGTAGVPATVDISARAHVLKTADSVSGIFYSLAYEIIKDTLIHEFNTVKVLGVTLRAQIPGRVTLEARLLGHDFSDGGSGMPALVNTTTTIDTVTGSANKEIAQARQMAVWLNAQAAGALSGSDAKHVTAVELNINRILEADYSTEFGDRSSEPVPPNGEGPFFTVDGSMTFKNLKNGTPGNSGFVANQLNRDLQKIILRFIGDGLAGAATEKYSHILYLPMVAFGDGKPALAGGGNGWTLPFSSYHVDAIPTGFPAGYLDACTWVNTNKDTADPLA